MNILVEFRIASAYRKVSVPAVFVIAGTIPVYMLVTVRMEIFKAKSPGNHITGHFRENTISKCNYDGTIKIEEGEWRDLFQT